MLREDAVWATARVIAVLPQGRFRVELSNGHRLVARVRRGGDRWGLVLGDRVAVVISTCDISRGRIERVERNECLEAEKEV